MAFTLNGPSKKRYNDVDWSSFLAERDYYGDNPDPGVVPRMTAFGARPAEPEPEEEIAIEGPPEPTRLDRLEADYNAKPSMRERLLTTALPAVGIGLGAIFGGEAGATGAAAGYTEGMQRNLAQEQRRKQTLLAQIQAEQDRQQQAAQTQWTQGHQEATFREQQEHNAWQRQQAEQKAPETISSPDGSTYQWDPIRKTFTRPQVAAGDNAELSGADPFAPVSTSELYFTEAGTPPAGIVRTVGKRKQTILDESQMNPDEVAMLGQGRLQNEIKRRKTVDPVIEAQVGPRPVRMDGETDEAFAARDKAWGEKAERLEIARRKAGSATMQLNIDQANRALAGTPDVATGQRNEAFLATLPPTIQGIVKRLVDYEEKPGVISARSLNGPILSAYASKYDPSWDSSMYEVRQAFRKEWHSTNRAAGANKVALNTAINHLSKVAEAAQALRNGNTKVINTFKNWVKTELGYPQVTTFEGAMSAVAGELANVFKRTGATQEEIRNWESKMNQNMSRRQYGQLFDTLVDLLAGRMDALQYSYLEVMGTPPPTPVLSPAARGIVEKLGYDPLTLKRSGKKAAGGAGGGGVTVSHGGATYTFPNKLAADQFKSEMGIK